MPRIVHRTYARLCATKKKAAEWGGMHADQAAERMLGTQTRKCQYLKQLVTDYKSESADMTRKDLSHLKIKQIKKNLQSLLKAYPTIVAQKSRRRFQQLADRKQRLCNELATGTHVRKKRD